MTSRHETAIHYAVFALPDPALSAPTLLKSALAIRNPAPALQSCVSAIQTSVFVLLNLVQAIHTSFPAIREPMP